jgi:DNA-binding beta-propeller fold protein YncE
VVRSWGGPGDGFEWPENAHGIHVDPRGNVWIGGNGTNDAHVLKFSGDGEFLLQIGQAGQSTGSNDTMNLGRPAAIEVDPEAREVYIADGYGNRRVIVFDADTGEYKRHWGAYGERPDDQALPAYDPTDAPSRHYRSPVHGVAIANDGFVYVADRTNNRLQVFQKDGQFVTEAFIRPDTLGSGTASGVTLSEDADQRWLFIPDGTNNVVWILDRETLEVVDYFGRLGKNAGQFYRLHNLAIDSRGNLYTTEVNVGQRLQKFDRIGG